MPLFEHVCANKTCEKYGRVEEHLFKVSDPAPPCEACHLQTRRCISRPQIVWTRPFGEYGDKKLEYYNPDGHVAWRVRSTRDPEGKPEKVFIDSRQKQLEYCREEGLTMPDDYGPMNVQSDGSAGSTQGLPGCWV